jgi:dolichol-phosphate mannosyltransferase
MCIPKLSVIIPVYFNSESLPLLFDELSKLEASLAEEEVATEFIFVDDGSRDESFARILSFYRERDNVVAIRLSKNFGSMAALRTGLDYVTGDAFAFISADLQEPPELLVKMVRAWQSGAKYVVCSRESRDDPRITKLTSWIYYRLLEMFVVKGYPRGGYDLSLMDKVMLPYLRRSAQNTNILLYAFSLGYDAKEITYNRMKRRHGASRWTFGKRLNLFFDSILGFSILPMRYVSAFGLLVSAGSFAYSAFVVFMSVFVSRPPPGWASTAVLVSFLFGVVILMVAIIGEYTWRIFKHVTSAPTSVIDEIYQ